MNKDISGIRREYLLGELNEENALADPFELFKLWMALAVDSDNPEPTAMTLSTIGEDNRPTARIVLLKGLEKGRFIFYTNYVSRKAKEIDTHNQVALNFFWPELEKQVRIEGQAEKVTSQESNEYFKSRPRESRIGAWVSHQSSVLTSRKALEEQFEAMEKNFEGKEIERPNYWGGYAIAPDYFEFWIDGEFRLHQRYIYKPDGQGGWDLGMLYP